MAFYRLEPFDGVRGDLHAAIVAQTIANVNRPSGHPAYKLSDFMLDFAGKSGKEPQTYEEQIDIMAQLTRALAKRGK